jgi:enoyl-CoA hydratase/carnithine racemase
MDLDEAVSPAKDLLDDVHAKLFSLGRRAMKPIVMCVNGAALGGGLGLVAQGHIVVASQSAAFALPEIRLGLWPLLVYRSVEAALGSRRTLELSLTGRLFHSEEALAWGLVSRVAHPDEVHARAKSIANDLAKASPQALEAGFRLLAECDGASSEDAMNAAVKIRRTLMESDDFREGVAAFKERREPRWPSITE